MTKLKVTLIKSAIGYNKQQKRTVEALGLKKLNTSRVLTDTPQIRGMLNSVQHLIAVEEVKE